MTIQPPLKIAFASDDTSPSYQAVLSYLKQHHHIITPTNIPDGPDQSWPDMSRAVAQAVADGQADYGILMCWTGTGTAMMANKIIGIRAAMAFDPWIAANARRWNDANILTLSTRRTAPDIAVECVEAFLSITAPDPSEAPSIAKLNGL